MCVHVCVCMRCAGLGDSTTAELALWTIRVGGHGGYVHISKISSATKLVPPTGLMHQPQLTQSHDRDLEYTTGSVTSDSLICSLLKLELNVLKGSGFKKPFLIGEKIFQCRLILCIFFSVSRICSYSSTGLFLLL